MKRTIKKLALITTGLVVGVVVRRVKKSEKVFSLKKNDSYISYVCNENNGTLLISDRHGIELYRLSAIK